MSDLVKRIEGLHKQGKFSQLPRGPLGRYIQVNDRRYKEAVENILSPGLLMSFCVNNDKDRITLTNVLKQFNEFRSLQVITSRFFDRVHDVSRQGVRINANVGRTLMDLIKVTDPVVMNTLIDNKHIETVVFVDDSDSAMAITEHVQNVPRNLGRVILLNPFTEFIPAPSFRSYALQRKPSRFIQTDFEEVIENAQQQKAQLEAKIADMNERLRTTSAEARDFDKNVQEKKKLIEQLMRKDKEYTEQLQELKNTEYPEENLNDILKQELADVEKKKRLCQKKLKELEENVMKSRKVSKSKEAEWKDAKIAAQSARNEMHIAQKEIEEEQNKMSTMEDQIRIKSNQLATLRKDSEDFTKEADEYTKEITAKQSVITGVRVESDRTVDQIQQSIRKAQTRIRGIESYNENIEEVEQLMNDKKGQLDHMAGIQTSLNACIEKVCINLFHILSQISNLPQF